MDSSQVIFHEDWRLKRLAVCLSVGFFLFLSWWYVPLIRQGWDYVDKVAFYLLNGSLTEGRTWWRYLWAFANTRLFDLFITSAQLGIFVFAGRLTGALSRFAQFAFFYGYSHATLWAMHAGTTALFHIKRWSPNAVLPDGNRLTGIVSGWHVKDVSWCSFPGDHCVIAMLAGLFTWLYRGPKVGIPAVFLALSVSAPRLFSGAHWATDLLVGSAFITFILFGLMAYTPLHRVGYAYTTQPCLRFLANRCKALKNKRVKA